MGLASEAAAIIGTLKQTITEALEGDVAEIAKQKLSESALTNVYGLYTQQGDTPRRGTNGGLADTDTMDSSVTDDTLTVSDSTAFQQLYGGTPPDARLDDVIESGAVKFHMGAAGARPYYADAEKSIAEDGEIDAAIQRAIDRV